MSYPSCVGWIKYSCVDSKSEPIYTIPQPPMYVCKRTLSILFQSEVRGKGRSTATSCMRQPAR